MKQVLFKEIENEVSSICANLGYGCMFDFNRSLFYVYSRCDVITSCLNDCISSIDSVHFMEIQIKVIRVFPDKFKEVYRNTVKVPEGTSFPYDAMIDSLRWLYPSCLYQFNIH